jgi:hypothetical protein
MLTAARLIREFAVGATWRVSGGSLRRCGKGSVAGDGDGVPFRCQNPLE